MVCELNTLEFTSNEPRPVTDAHRELAGKIAEDLWKLPFESITPVGEPHDYWGRVFFALKAIAERK